MQRLIDIRSISPILLETSLISQCFSNTRNQSAKNKIFGIGFHTVWEYWIGTSQFSSEIYRNRCVFTISVQITHFFPDCFSAIRTCPRYHSTVLWTDD